MHGNQASGTYVVLICFMLTYIKDADPRRPDLLRKQPGLLGVHPPLGLLPGRVSGLEKTMDI